ncbi:cation transporter [Paenibacillus sp. B01]|uniref:cation transporter n=1 Tax=Paenibacillus sp. B01 TaxID=2660554 RepID=UPI00129B786D|nr:cation transporter [Paenibacillus sp. B01]QGG57241.1 cation diffusion facilitator family transporter [Paenibacillus sp. B01]
MAIKLQPAADSGKRGTAVHIGLALAKGTSGALLGSSAVLSDAFRSAADACGSYLSSGEGARRGRSALSRRWLGGAEHAPAYLFSILLMLIGLELAMLAVQDLLDPPDLYPRWPAAFVVPACLVIRLLLVRGAAPATEWLSSIAATAGAGAAWAGGESGIEWLLYMDPIASALIAAVLVSKGYGLIMQAGRPRIETRQADDGLASDLMELIQRVDGVVTVEAVQPVHNGGKLAADIVISVNPRISVMEGSEIAGRVRTLVQKRFLQIVEMRICVEPYNPGYPYKSNHDPNQEHMPTLLQ